MNKKVGIAIGVGVLVLIIAVVAAVIIKTNFNNDLPVNVEDEINSDVNSVIIDGGTGDEFVGKPLPNIINKAGTIKRVGKNRVIINGPDDKEITIYIEKNTQIYGPDGRDKEISDLEEGMYITIDIDGDERAEDDPDDEFDAMIIYISGK